MSKISYDINFMVVIAVVVGGGGGGGNILSHETVDTYLKKFTFQCDSFILNSLVFSYTLHK